MNPGRADSGAIHTEHMSRERDPEMSTAYGTLDQAAPSAHPHAQQPLADRSGQQAILRGIGGRDHRPLLPARRRVQFWEQDGSDHPRPNALRRGQRDRLRRSEQGRYL
jgi:hypothetical protein